MKLVKKTVSGILAAVMLITSICVLPASAFAQEGFSGTQLYVSAAGNDANDGSVDSPLKTLEGARNKIRQIKAGGLPAGGITVNLRQGDYKYVENSFALEAQDSGTAECPIIYRAYPGEKVTITGNLEAKGTDFTAVTEPEILARLSEGVRDKVKVFDLAEKMGITDFSPIPKNGFGWPDQASALGVTVDGESQTLSRYPNEGFVNIDKAYSKGFVPRDHASNPDGSCPACTATNANVKIPCKIGEENWVKQEGGVFGSKALKDKYDMWKQESDIWTSGYFFWDWADDNCGISKVELDGNMLKLTTAQPSRYGIKSELPKTKFYAYNLLCEIDKPGEWYLDRENAKLYLYPTKDLSTASVELAMMGKPFIRAENVDYVAFENFDFSKGNSHGIELVDCNNTRVAGCTFSDLGQRAVVIGKIVSADSFEVFNEGAHGGTNNLVLSCDVRRTGQGGVYVAGGNRYTLEEADNKVVNCYFDDYATVKRTYSPAIALMGVGLEASNNVITNAPHMAVSFDGNEITIKNNDISHVCYETSDSGAIYSVRRWSFRGNQITNNYIHDMNSNSGIGSAAVYLDDLFAGTSVTNNLFVNIAGYTSMIGGGRDNNFSNNLQINNNNGKGIQYDARGLGWAFYHAQSPNGMCYAEWLSMKNNPKLDLQKWTQMYPELVNMSMDLGSWNGNSNMCLEGQKPAGATITKNLLVGVATPFGNINGNVKTMGNVSENESYPAGTDIGFVSPTTLNFEVKENSLIKQKLGDEHFKASQAGLFKDEFRKNVGTDIGTPLLTAPDNNAENVEIASGVKLSWQAASNAGSYVAELSKTEDFADIEQALSTTDTFINVGKLEKSTKYFWRVKAYEARLGGNSAVSEVRSFTTSDSDTLNFYEGFGSEGFDGWLVDAGTPTRTDSKAHTGSYSFISDEGKDFIYKTFSTPQATKVTLWLYDNMQSAKYTRAIASVYPADNSWAGMGVSAAESKDKYCVRIGASFVPTAVARSEGWHKLTWDYSSGTNALLYIDDIQVGEIQNTAGFVRIGLGDSWDQGGTQGDICNMMFDDLTVGTPQINPIPTSLTLLESEITLELGSQKTLQAFLKTDIDVDIPLDWSTYEYEIARVENGTVTAMRTGDTVLTVFPTGFPEVKATCTIHVVPVNYIPVDSVSLDITEQTITALDSFALTATALPENASDKTLIWSSSNPTAAAVTQDGKVYALNEGQAVITAASKDGGKTAVCTVTVQAIDYTENKISNPGFETGDSNGWSQYPALAVEGISIEATQEDKYAGDYAVKITTDDQIPLTPEGSGYAHKGVQFRAENPDLTEISPDSTYNLSAFLKIADDKVHNVGIRVTMRGSAASGSEPTAYTALSTDDGWVQLTAQVTPETLAKYPGTTKIDWIIGNENTTESAGVYYVDDTVLTRSVAHYPLAVAGGSGSGAYPAGANIVSVATAPEQQKFSHWEAVGLNLSDEDKVKETILFSMPSGEVSLTAVFEEIKAQTYTLTVNGGSGSGEYEAGTSVSVTLGSIPEGKQFTRWSAQGLTLSPADETATVLNFAMPQNEVTLTANFEALPSPSPEPKPEPAPALTPSPVPKQQVKTAAKPKSKPLPAYVPKDAPQAWLKAVQQMQEGKKGDTIKVDCSETEIVPGFIFTAISDFEITVLALFPKDTLTLSPSAIKSADSSKDYSFSQLQSLLSDDKSEASKPAQPSAPSSMPDSQSEAQPEKPASTHAQGNNFIWIIFGAITLIAAGAAAFLIIRKQKK